MYDEMLVRFCAPTLAGLKTGSLFSAPASGALDARIRAWNQALGHKGVRVLSLGTHAGKTRIYVYRPDRLSRDLQRADAQKLLRERGYAGDVNACLRRLRLRLRTNSTFPHEIGLFLGYPPDDVRGFIRYGAARSKCTGQWQVYGDAQAARRLFERYERCTRAYQIKLAHGITIGQLAQQERKQNYE